MPMLDCMYFISDPAVHTRGVSVHHLVIHAYNVNFVRNYMYVRELLQAMVVK